MSRHDIIKEIKSAHQNNNDWFYDRPHGLKLNDKMYEYAQMYFKLAAKWIELNDALTKSITVIEDQQSEIETLRAIIAKEQA